MLNAQSQRPTSSAVQNREKKKDTSWIAALSAPSLQLTSFAELEETLTEAEGSFILYSQVVVLTAKIAT